MADVNGGLGAAPVIIIKKKKKGGHGGHHGGAWKVAYADFVTALMALFIVLWIVNTSQEVRDAVSGYFKDPRGYGHEKGSTTPGVMKSGTTEEAAKNMEDLKKKLEEAMKKMPELEKLKNQIEMTITNEGLRIELLENEKGVFFESGSPHPTTFGQELIQMLAHEISKLPNRVLIEGHTDSRPYISTTGYGNWELSSDRANSARHLMQDGGLRQNQVSEVRGYADQKLRKPDDPQDASNRRISVTVKYIENGPPEQVKPANAIIDPKAVASESGKSPAATPAAPQREPVKEPPKEAAKKH